MRISVIIPNYNGEGLVGPCLDSLLSQTRPANQVIVNLVQAMGVKDETELHTLVESGRRMRELSSSDVDLERFRDECLDGLKLVLQREPTWRNGVLARLGSESEVGESGNGDG